VFLLFDILQVSAHLYPEFHAVENLKYGALVILIVIHIKDVVKNMYVDLLEYVLVVI
jgi:hypothetical protein